MKGRPLIYLLLLVATVHTCTDISSCFIKKLFDFSFPEENVYNIALNNDPGSLSTTVLGYGDFNTDLRTDYVALDRSTQDILFFYYQNGGDSEGQYTVKYRASLFMQCIPLNVYLCIEINK